MPRTLQRGVSPLKGTWAWNIHYTNGDSNVGDMDLILGQGTNILFAVEQPQLERSSHMPQLLIEKARVLQQRLSTAKM